MLGHPDTRVDKSALTRWRKGTEVPWGLDSPSQILAPVPKRFVGPRPWLLGASPGGPGMGGASRRRARLCGSPHPTLLRDRKAEPRLPEPPPPLPAVAVSGWCRLRFFACDGRSCRYGDRSVAPGAASLCKQNCPGPRHLLQFPSGLLEGLTPSVGRVRTRRREGSCSGWKGEGSLAFSESDLFADLFFLTC